MEKRNHDNLSWDDVHSHMNSMKKPPEYDINHIGKQIAYANFGRLLEPFFIGSDWDKLMELRKFYQAISQVSVEDDPNYAFVAHGFAQWFERVFNAIQEEGKRQAAEQKKEQDEFDRMKQNVEKFAPEMREVMEQMFGDSHQS